MGRGIAKWVLGAACATALGLGSPPAAAAQSASSCPWMDASKSPQQRASELVSAMTLQQKDQMLYQASTIFGHYGAAGYVPGQPGLCIPDLMLNDAGQGAGDEEIQTVAFPAGKALAASWDPAVARSVGSAIGWEALRKGINVVLAPGIEIDRVPVNGRNFEYQSEDPFLAGQGGAAFVRGVQSQHVIATIKHYIANSQETNRMSESSNVDDRTLHEIYAAPYETAIREAQPGAVMCSYNRINGVYACENADTLKRILEGQFGFDGFVMSDWGGTHSTVAAANNGLDMEMDVAPGKYFNQPLIDAVNAGQVSRARLDDMVLRITRAMFRVGLFDHPAAAEPAAYGADVRRPQDIDLSRRASEQGTVLLKNEGGVLPLTGQGQRIAIIGPGASPVGAQGLYNGEGSGHNPPVGAKDDVVSPLDGISRRAQAQGDSVLYADGSSQADAVAAATAADVAIVVVGTVDSEGQDRSSMTLQSGYCTLAACGPQPVDQDALISAVANANPHTVVVLDTGGPVTMPWLKQIKGLFEAWYPGQEDGNAIAALLFGDVNPSAKLPQTFPASEKDLPTAGSASRYPGVNDAQGVPQVSYAEKLLVGYRWYDAKGIEPLFPFGFGLSYTTFDLRNLAVAAGRPDATSGTVSFDVVNTGSRAGAEVPQLYVSDPASDGEPPRQLKGFTKVELAPGESRRVSLPLDFRSFAHYDTSAGDWRVTPGCYGLAVGRSSRDLPLRTTVSVGGASCPGAQLPLVTNLTSRAATPCLSRRSVAIHLFGVKRSQVRGVRVYVNGRRRQVLRGRRSLVHVTLGRLPKTTARIRLVISLGRRRSAVITRTYRTCLPKRAHRLVGGRARRGA